MSNSNGTQFEHDCDQQSWETVPQSGCIFPQKIRTSFYAMLDYFVCSFMDQNNVKTKFEILMYLKNYKYFFQFQCKVNRFLFPICIQNIDSANKTIILTNNKSRPKWCSNQTITKIRVNPSTGKITPLKREGKTSSFEETHAKVTHAENRKDGTATTTAKM